VIPMMVDWLRRLVLEDLRPAHDVEEVIVGAAAAEKAPA